MVGSLNAHPGAVFKSGKNKGCHHNKKTGVLHCHGKRPKKSKAGTYNRKLYPHWIDKDGDCQNERQELLIGRSMIPVIMKETRVKVKRCTVKSGTWRDFYYDELLTEASMVDVDHVVSLKHAHFSGARHWTKEKRTEFANDPDNLVLTNRKHNRKKGAKTPLEWLPINRQYACKYFNKWLFVKRKYGLKITKHQESEYMKMKCSDES